MKKLFFSPVYYLSKDKRTPTMQINNIYGPFNNRMSIEVKLDEINKNGEIKEILVFEGELFSVKIDQLKLK